MFTLLMLLSTLAYLWMCFTIARRSIPGAIVTLLFLLPSLYYLLTGWGDNEHDIRTPFFATLATSALAIMMIAGNPALREEIERASQDVRPPAAAMQARA